MLGTFSGGGLGFGVAFTLYDDFSRTAYHIERNLQRLGMSVTSVNNQIDKAMNRMAVGTGMLATGLATLAPIGMGVQIAGEFEQARFGLETLLKSKERAEEMFEGIKADAATTSFSVESLLWVNRALVSTGLGAREARTDAMNLANAIAAVGGSNDHLYRMATNMQQIRNIGKANGLDIKQFGYAGINIYKLLEETTGLHIDQLKEMDITYDQIATALAHAAAEGGMYHGALEKQASSILGILEQVSDRVKYMGAAIGEAVMPVIRPTLYLLLDIFSKIADFAETDAGKTIFQMIAGGAALLTVLGGLILAMGFAEFAAYRMALAFGTATKAKIFAALEAKNLAAAWRIMGVAGLRSLGPLLVIGAQIAVVGYAFYKAWQYISSGDSEIAQLGYAIMLITGPVGWLIGGIMGIVAGLKDFDAYMAGSANRMRGIAGFFQRLGGVIRGVQMVFETWGIAGANTFALTPQMENFLHSIGVLETVIAIATWLARIKAFMSGVVEGMVFLAKSVKEVAVTLVNAFMPVGKEFRDWEDMLARNTDSLETWKEAGRIAGFVLGLVILGLTTYFFAMGVSALFALWPIIATIALVIASIVALAVMVKVAGLAWDALDAKTRETSRKFKQYWKDEQAAFEERNRGIEESFMRLNADLEAHCDRMDAAFMEVAGSVFTGFGQMFSFLGSEFGALAERAYTWGVNFLSAFFDGIKSVGLGIADWFTNGPIGSALQGKVYYGTSAPARTNRTSRGLDSMARSKAEQFVMPASMGGFGGAPTASSQPLTVNLVVDNETMFSKVLDLMNLQEGRA